MLRCKYKIPVAISVRYQMISKKNLFLSISFWVSLSNVDSEKGNRLYYFKVINLDIFQRILKYEARILYQDYSIESS